MSLIRYLTPYLMACALLCLNQIAYAAQPSNTPPTAYIGGDINSGKPLFNYDDILLVGMGTDVDGDALTYSWSFGDGTTALGEQAHHRYLKEGSYTLTLTVSDGILKTNDQRIVQIKYQSLVSWAALPTGDTQLARNWNANYGGTDEMNIYNGEYPDYRAVLQFPVDTKPVPPSDDALYLGSFLELSCIEDSLVFPKTQVFALTRDWVAGTGMASGNSGATWQTYNGIDAWASGGEYNQTLDFGYGENGVVTEINNGCYAGARISYDVSVLAEAWWAGTMVNNGVLIGMPSGLYYNGVNYASSENTTYPGPQLSHKYVVGNFVRNSDAEQGLSGWSMTSRTRADAVPEGGHAIFAIYQSTPEGTLYQNIDLSHVDAIDSQTLQLKVSAQMRTSMDNAYSGKPFVTVQIYDANAVLLKEAATPFVASVQWTGQSVLLPIPKGARNVVVSLKRSPSTHYSTTTNPAAYFDTIALAITKME